MPEWIIPCLLALVGGGGMGALINPLVTRRGDAFQEMHTLVKEIKEERNEARNAANDLRIAGEYATGQLYAERKYTARLEEWAARGAPPPPPTRDEVLAAIAVVAASTP